MPFKDMDKRREMAVLYQRKWRLKSENRDRERNRGRMYDKKRYPMRKAQHNQYDVLRWRQKQEKKYGVRYPTWWLCDICSKPISLFKGEINLDHDYRTNRFRGWLCRGCNGPLGRFEKFRDGFKRYLQW